MKWIRVEDRLPEVNTGPWLVSYGGRYNIGYYRMKGAGRPKGEPDTPVWSTYNNMPVRYWMPLPAPPKEGE